jgi:oligogalacturonide lyase
LAAPLARAIKTKKAEETPMRLVLAALLAAASMTALAGPAHATLGQRYPSEMKVITDPVTGRKLNMMTTGEISESKLYPTDQQWAFDGRHIIFRSGQRAKGEGSQIFAMDDTTGEFIQITGGQGGGGTSSIMVSRAANKVYYLRREEGRQILKVIDLDALLRDSRAGRISPAGYEKALVTLPEGFRIAGGFTIDADDKTAYFGFADPIPEGTQFPAEPRIRQWSGGLMAFDLATGAQRVVVKTPFTVGHIQANPFKPGEVMYCNETGGDAATRMWVVSGDGSDNRPVYVEGPDDWVTHEQFADADHVIFNMMAHTAKLRKKPSGIFVVSLRDGAMENLGQVPWKAPAPETTPRSGPNSFWHNGVTYDGRFAAGDDFDGNLWLIDRSNGARMRLTAGHLMKPDHIHPSFSPDGTKIYFQSGMLTKGERQHLVIIPIGDLTKK